MPLAPGDRLGPYRIDAPIGAGGMGEVYRARDTSLDRDVAIKVLPDAFANDPERLARFEREAKVLASLNHPNIGGIHGLEKSGDTRALVLELVEGPTLADRIAQGPIPVDEALPIAKQIAEALEAAHEQGIIHRDLKPANIKLRPDGTVKVLDFGLAKALEGEQARVDQANSPTLTAAASQMGVIIGTAAYMSPEQARGKAVDRRADIWAFGAVLFEMLTGMKPFPGDDVSQTLARVIDRDPDWSALPEGIPPPVLTYLHRCLHKDPKQRVQAAGDVRLAMEGAFDGSVRATPVEIPTVTRAQRSSTLGLALGLGGLVLGGLLVGVASRSSVPAPRVARFAVTVPPEVIDGRGAPVPLLALSRDGSVLAVRVGPTAAVGGRLALRQLDQLDAELMEGPEDVTSPVFSPNGEWVAYFDSGAGALKRVSVRGGTPLTICPVDGFFGASWAEDDTIVFAGRAGLFRVPAVGGVPELVLPIDPGAGYVWPEALPGGRAVLFVAGALGSAGIRAVELDTGEVVDIVPGGTFPRYLPTGYLTYTIEGTLWATNFDATRLATIGDPVPVLEGVATGGFGAAQYSVADDGSLAYIAGGSSASERTFVWVNREGEEAALSLPPRAYLSPRLSPDGRQMAVRVRQPGAGWAVWVFDVVSAAGRQLTREGDANTVVWTPDGESVVFTWNNPPGGGYWDLHVARVDGSEIRRVTSTPTANEQPTSVTPDGQFILTVQINADGSRDVMAIPIDGDGEPTPVLQGGGFARGNAAVSPDGNWLAYRSDQSGQMEIYLQPYPGPGPTVPVSRGGGDMVIWSADGSELFYRRGTAVMAVTVEPDGRVGQPTELFDGGHFTQAGMVRQYHVAPDGRFLMVKEGNGAAATEARLVWIQNWTQELLERVPVP